MSPMKKEPLIDKTLLITLAIMVVIVVVFMMLPEPAPWALAK
jgi:hypothetical protein